MSDVFISYARADLKIALRITKALENQGFTVFTDQTTLVAGTNFEHTITKAISSSKAVIAILSANSKRSLWVENELQNALEAKKIVIPVLVDDEGRDNWVWPLLSDRQAFRLTDDSSADELVRYLSALLESRTSTVNSSVVGHVLPEPAKIRPNRSGQFRFIAVIVLLSALLGALGAVILTNWLN